MSSPLNPNKPRPPPVNIDNSRSLTGSPPDGLQTPRGNHALTRTLTPQTPTSPGFLNSVPYTDAPPSQEHLLPPSRDRFKKHYSPSISSRRSSISSFDSNGDIRYGPYAGNDPFSDSRAPSRSGSPTNDDKYEDEVEDLNSDTIAYNKRFDVTPKDGILLYRDQPEPDDDMHDPHKDDGEKEGDCNIWTKRGVVNVGVLVVFMLALVGLLVGYPIMMFIDHYASQHAKRSFDTVDVVANLNMPPPSLHTIVPDTMWTEGMSQTVQKSGEDMAEKEEQVKIAHPHHHDHSGLGHRHLHNRRRRRNQNVGVTGPSSREGGNMES